MATHADPSTVERVSCEVCLTEIPKSEAISQEASDYFVHFCGLDCFEKWKAEEVKPVPPADASA